jgi:hypothetical protein
MLAEPWGYTRKNIALLVLVEVWAARQRPPYLGGGIKLRHVGEFNIFSLGLPQSRFVV